MHIKGFKTTNALLIILSKYQKFVVHSLLFFLLITGHWPLVTAVYGAGFGKSDAGTAAAQFLKIGVGARAVAMGEAYSAMAEDAFSLYWNPAGMIKIKKQSFVMMHSEYLASTFLEYLAYAQNAGEVGAWGISMQYMDNGKLSRTDLSGYDIGNFRPYDVALSVGFACYITGFNKDPEDRFVLGATGKFVRSKIILDDNTVSADMGIIFPYMFDRKFRLAFAAHHIMGSLRLDKVEYPLPLTFRLGTVTEINKNLSMTGDIVASRDNYPYVALGGELKIKASQKLNLFLRSGLNTRGAFELTGFRNLTFGTGLQYGRYSIDYAFSPYGDIGNAHRISISMNY